MGQGLYAPGVWLQPHAGVLVSDIPGMVDRAVVFVDGNNWYHSLKKLGLGDLGRLDYGKVSLKLLGPREWVGTRYYIGRVPQSGDTALYSSQRQFLASLCATDGRISTHLGRLERRPVDDPVAKELRRYLASLQTRIDQEVYQALMSIAGSREGSTVLVEKAVDVMLAVDMVVMAERDQYDAAYLLSADGDFTPAVAAVRAHEKKVYTASPAAGAQLASVANSYIRLPRDWFDDCYR
jgi:uncharacterized LabA/DUF88 family protein